MILDHSSKKVGPYNNDYQDYQTRGTKTSGPRSFANLMLKKKTHAALDLLANHGKGGVLHLDDHASLDDPHSLSVFLVYCHQEEEMAYSSDDLPFMLNFTFQSSGILLLCKAPMETDRASATPLRSL